MAEGGEEVDLMADLLSRIICTTEERKVDRFCLQIIQIFAVFLNNILVIRLLLIFLWLSQLQWEDECDASVMQRLFILYFCIIKWVLEPKNSY